MKHRMKAAALLLVLLMVWSLTACGSNANSAFIGTWNAVSAEAYEVTMTMEEVDMTFQVEIKDDGTVVATTNGEEDGEATWEEDNGVLTISDSSDTNITGEINDEGQLVLDFDGIVFYLEK